MFWGLLIVYYAGEHYKERKMSFLVIVCIYIRVSISLILFMTKPINVVPNIFIAGILCYTDYDKKLLPEKYSLLLLWEIIIKV